MTELVTQDRATRPKPKRDKVRMVADDVVTAEFAGDASRHDAAERGAADGGGGDRAAQRWLLRSDRHRG